MKKKSIIGLISAIVVVILLLAVCFGSNIKETYEEKFISITSYEELDGVINYKYSSSNNKTEFLKDFFISLATAPWSFEYNSYNGYRYAPRATNAVYYDAVMDNGVMTKTAATKEMAIEEEAYGADGDYYSTTNVQVENVDEADTIKTDGTYIYSFSDTKTIITDAKSLNIVAVIEEDNMVPQDMIISNNKLVIIYYATNNYEAVTGIYTYDLENINDVKNASKVVVDGSYYTSRRIDDNVIVFTEKYVYEPFKPVIMFNDELKELDYSILKYQRESRSHRNLTYITSFNLSELDKLPEVNGYFMNLSEAYVSDKNIYVMEQNYTSGSYDSDVRIRDFYGPLGIFGPFISEYENNDYYGYVTKIKKFNLDGNKITFSCKGEVKGRTINQFSFDEYGDYFRVALTTDDGNGVIILDKNLNLVGELMDLAKGEQIYSSRFIEDRLYLVTYKNTDPLFVIDLSDAKNPKELGELKMPGYSTYLHPYDENHLIGIGRETEEVINKDAFGRVTSTWTRNKGLKMALFDVSDVSNPKLISKVEIGDSRTASNILENHKALLFSKERNLIAIPVNGYNEDIEEYDSLSYDQRYRQSGFTVYNITLDNGFVKKGTIMHDMKRDYNGYYWNYSQTPVRGLYIGDKLYTISNNYIKANNISNLAEINSLDILSKLIEKEER